MINGEKVIEWFKKDRDEIITSKYNPLDEEESEEMERIYAENNYP